MDFSDATSALKYLKHKFLDTNVLNRNHLFRLHRVWGADVINHQIKDYLLAELHEYNREHFASVRAVGSLKSLMVQLYGHYEGKEHVDIQSDWAIETQDIQDYLNNTILYDEEKS